MIGDGDEVIPTKCKSHLILSQFLNFGGRRGTTDEVATMPLHLPCLPLPFTVSCRIVFIMPEELRCGHTVSVSVSLPWLRDPHALQLHSGFCCGPPLSSHGTCRKCSEVSYSISSQGLGSFSRFLLSRSTLRNKGRW